MQKKQNCEQENKSINTAELMVKCLENEGVEYIFGIPGEENLAVIDALNRSSIRFIITRHEQGAAFMADVYGRLTGHAGVCLATLGPGATNLVTGVADANGDGAPLVAITGQVGTERMHITSHQYLDLTKMYEPVSKRTKLVVRPDTINEIVRLAFKYAESERPGAAHIDLPVNISKMTISSGGKPLKRVSPHKEFADISNIESAAAEIFKAKKPVILAGSSAVRNHAFTAITRFAETLKIPVVNTMMAKGIIPCTSKYAMMTIGIPQKDYANQIVAASDLIIAIGYDIVEYSPSKWNPDGSIPIIHVGTRPAHINKCYQCRVEVVGDISKSLELIQARTDRYTEPEFALSTKAKFKAEQSTYADDRSFPAKPQKILHDVRQVMGEDDILLSDVGAHKMWIARLYECHRPNTCIISNGFATMGIALPGAIAAKLVYPDQKVLAVVGDGGFMMNVQELETAVRLKLNFVVLIFHDCSYGLIKWKQMDQYGANSCVDFTNPDFVRLAEAMYCKGYRIEKVEDLIPTLENAFAQKVPAIIDCMVDYSENVKLSKHLQAISSELMAAF
ncbi:acetolactate synthase large subunit [Ethanoligenens sp.]|uniref:acetolactate synthase large subunit n=1 Tax=Ethanoligenens sp. TaxID=2099655 RepID=UPI0039ED71E7